jgi:hypothetical protein
MWSPNRVLLYIVDSQGAKESKVESSGQLTVTWSFINRPSEGTATVRKVYPMTTAAPGPRYW